MGHVAPPSRSHPFDTALRAYSGQAVDLQEATSRFGIRVAEYCPVIDQWHLPYGRGETCLRACLRVRASRSAQTDRQRSEVVPWVT